MGMVEIWFLALGLAGLGNRPEARSPAKVWGRPHRSALLLDPFLP